ncbi:hypothetical protein ACMD2_04147 [Ananas comosus]|uniref:Uncharacterized protein n=1 Tax=Ananas comosus TaxID=4615 RepID=A0A199W8N0_ANACO|nr:hypothetical protein ACMD2_04147 [Ananas comosus]
MEKDDDDRCFFPLTSLQIGDLQSYLSRLTLFLVPKSKKFLILVDNRPWLIDLGTRPAHLWQLMVTKSRLSPFANTSARRKRVDNGKRLDFSNSSGSTPVMRNKLSRWYTVIDAAISQKKTLLPVKKLKESSFLLNKELHRTLYGFIVFEVEWAHVRGINYLNELQTDTSMVLEAKIMKRWEFDSIEQASTFIFSWYSGSYYECTLLRDYLDSNCNNGDVFYDAQEDISTHRREDDNRCNADFPEEKFIPDNSRFTCSPYTSPPSDGPYKRRKIIKSNAFDEDSVEVYSEIVGSPRYSESSSSSPSTDSESSSPVFGPTIYKDVLILFRFNDHDLPFKLKEVIMSDLRLLTLLEYGLPSWVIFFQSYPVFCKIYRPWMCPLARALYVLISVITVLIGFYDLYKNVPLLKATASRLFGPFFDWIETWEMVSRIKYLGTMLFLHNFEVALKWFLSIMRATKSVISILTKPIAGPLMELVELILPLWNICVEAVESVSSVIWLILGSSYSIIVGTVQVIVWPFWFAFSTLWNLAMYVIYPIFWVLLEILVAPVRLVLALANYVAMLFVNMYYLLGETWSSVSAMLQFASTSKTSVSRLESSMWRSLWNDLFSQVFRALRSILYGFVAFFATCNRHRLSIYNHIRGFLLRVSEATQTRHPVASQGRSSNSKIDPLADFERPTARRIPHSQEKFHRRRSKSKDM